MCGRVAYSVTKAAQLHLMRCLASTEGPKVRVNAVLPGWLATEWVCILLLFCSWSLEFRMVINAMWLGLGNEV